MPASYAFPPIRRGDTKTVAVYLVRKGIRTLERSPLLQPGDVVVCLLTPPGGAAQTRAVGAADIDLATGKVSLPFTADQTAAMPSGTTKGRLRVTDTDGVVTTHLDFTLLFTD